jgi:hypothetical protein
MSPFERLIVQSIGNGGGLSNHGVATLLTSKSMFALPRTFEGSQAR